MLSWFKSTYGWRHSVVLGATCGLVMAACGDKDPQGGGGDSEDELQPPSFEVDAALSPETSEIPGRDGSGPRPVASIADANGNQADFVANELVVSTSDEQAVQQLVERWNGEVLVSFTPSRSELEQIEPHYLIRVNVSSAKTEELAQNIRALDPDSRGEHRISSEKGKQLLAAAASEKAVNGLDVGVNWILQGDGIADRSTAEASSGEDGFTPDAYQWPYMNRGSNQDIGVGEAWRMLEAAGKLDNKVSIAIADGGFVQKSDLPAERTMYPNGAYQQRHPYGCGGNSSCPWHGTHVAEAAMSIPDNGSGVAGPAGPIAKAVFSQFPSPDLFTVVEYLISLVEGIAGERPRIVNISAGGSVPAAAAVLANSVMNEIGPAFRALGTLVIASAGNDGENLDAEDCFIACWEEAAYVPCENDGIICVGGLKWDSTAHHPNSNWSDNGGGSNSVDIHGPFEVYTGSDPDDSSIKKRGGTSFSAPFVAGVAGLVWAADPSLSPGQVESILMDTAHTESDDGKVDRWVNAYAAVRNALGGDAPPFVDITSPQDGAAFVRGEDVISLDAEVQDEEDAYLDLDISWRSDKDGEISSFADDEAEGLSYGEHELTLTVTDTAGQTVRESVNIEVINQPPTLEILQPTNGATFYTGESITFEAVSEDPNLPADVSASLADNAVVWRSNLDGDIGTGHTLDAALGTGAHAITVEGTDQGGAIGTASISLTVDEAPQDLPPSVDIVSPNTANDQGDGDDPLYVFATSDEDWSARVRLEVDASDDDGINQIEWTTRTEPPNSDLQNETIAFGNDQFVGLQGAGLGCTWHRVTVIVTDTGNNERRDTERVCIFGIGG